MVFEFFSPLLFETFGSLPDPIYTGRASLRSAPEKSHNLLWSKLDQRDIIQASSGFETLCQRHRNDQRLIDARAVVKTCWRRIFPIVSVRCLADVGTASQGASHK